MQSSKRLLTLGILAAVAVGGASAGCDDAALTPDTARAFEVAYVRGLCRSFLQCPTQGAHGRGERPVQAQLESVDECARWAAAVEGAGQPTAPAWAAAVDAGLARYDRAAAEACLGWLSSTCAFDYEGQRPAIDPCGAAVVGLQAVGQPCEESFHCRPGAYCLRESESCGGSCVAAVPLGGRCSSDEECGSPSRRYCELAASPNGRCAEAPRPFYAAVGSRCGGSQFCEAGAACDSDSLCQAPLAAGGRCDDDAVCPPRTLCLPDDTGGGRHCRAPPIRSQVGAPCGPGLGMHCAWLEGLGCIDGSCRRVSAGGEGDRCAVEVPNTCAGGLVCHTDASGASRCRTPIGETGQCTASFECHPALVCQAGECLPPDC